MSELKPKAIHEALPVEFSKALALARLRLDCAVAIMANGSQLERRDKCEIGNDLYDWVTQGLQEQLGIAVKDNSRKRA